MLKVGLTAVAEHPTLAANGKTSTLGDLAQYFPVIEMDTGFYHIPSVDTVRRWQQQVPSRCQFIIKASQYMTMHRQDTAVDVRAEFDALEAAVAPLVASGQLAALLFQMPPYFGVTATNVHYFYKMRTRYPELPVAVEFRNSGWYLPQYRASALALLRELRLIHVVVDEPQTPAASVPCVLEATNPELTIMRLHGRNYAGWQSGKRPGRTNYRYAAGELQELAAQARGLASRDVAVIFNNNGGGDAAANALAFIAQEHLQYQGLAPRQTTLF